MKLYDIGIAVLFIGILFYSLLSLCLNDTKLSARFAGFPVHNCVVDCDHYHK